MKPSTPLTNTSISTYTCTMKYTATQRFTGCFSPAPRMVQPHTIHIYGSSKCTTYNIIDIVMFHGEGHAIYKVSSTGRKKSKERR